MNDVSWQKTLSNMELGLPLLRFRTARQQELLLVYFMYVGLRCIQQWVGILR